MRGVFPLLPCIPQSHWSVLGHPQNTGPFLAKKFLVGRSLKSPATLSGDGRFGKRSGKDHEGAQGIFLLPSFICVCEPNPSLSSLKAALSLL